MNKDTCVYRNNCDKIVEGGKIYYGNRPPRADVGNNGDFYLDVISNLFYGPKYNCKWNNNPFTMKGPQGSPGTTGTSGNNGTPGVPGTEYLSGVNAPLDTQGDIGNYYLQIFEDNVLLYGPKTDDEFPWGSPISLVGGDGPQGPQGSVIYGGFDVPNNNIGTDGDFYIEYYSSGFEAVEAILKAALPADGKLTLLYGPKENNIWPSTGVVLTGDNGPPGEDGSDGATILSSDHPPYQEQGNNGDFYIQIEDNDAVFLYGPKEDDIWGTGVSLIGKKGFNGDDGTNGNHLLRGINEPLIDEGDSGDFYFQITGDGSVYIYGPKNGTNWGLGTYLNGPIGQNGVYILSGVDTPEDEGENGDFYIKLGDDTTETILYGPKTEELWGPGIVLNGSDGTNGISGVQVSYDAANMLVYYDSDTGELESTGIQYVINNPCQNDSISNTYVNGKIQIAADGEYLFYYSDNNICILQNTIDQSSDLYSISFLYTYLGSTIYKNHLGIISYLLGSEGGNPTLNFKYEIYDIYSKTLLKTVYDYHTITGSLGDIRQYTIYSGISISDNYFVIQKYALLPDSVVYQSYNFSDLTNPVSTSAAISGRYKYDNIQSNDTYVFSCESDTIYMYTKIRLLNSLNSIVYTFTDSSYLDMSPIIYDNILALTPIIYSIIGDVYIYFFNMSNYISDMPQYITKTLNKYSSITGYMNSKYLTIDNSTNTNLFSPMLLVFDIQDLQQNVDVDEYMLLDDLSIIQSVVNNKYVFLQNYINYNSSISLICLTSPSKQLLFPDGSKNEPPISFMNNNQTGIYYIPNDPTYGQSIGFTVNGTLSSLINSSGMHSISDPKMKKNMIEFTNGLDLLNTFIKPYTYSFKNESDDIVHYGFNARELLESYTSEYNVENNQFGAVVDANDKLLLNYSEFISICVSAIKELNNTLNSQDEELNQLELLLHNIINN